MSVDKTYESLTFCPEDSIISVQEESKEEDSSFELLGSTRNIIGTTHEVDPEGQEETTSELSDMDEQAGNDDTEEFSSLNRGKSRY
ncbi:unnamed protein product [Protopolystoma xenopodis]|uniref:Uncharacterized protein n=1 Tax=Protopolystoma xenopodis TaxID=117903 RepID=A0A3S4ZW65_9PLAT|nr:unnamed protein product [Protopolystoma xenopodis]